MENPYYRLTKFASMTLCFDSFDLTTRLTHPITHNI